MSRFLLVLTVVGAVAAAGVMSSASAGTGQASAKKKCKTNYVLKKGKCVKKPAAATLKDGDYTYKQGSVGSAPVNTLTISGKGTKVRIREQFFTGGVDPADQNCAQTMIDFGTLKLTKSGNVVSWSSGGKPAIVPPIQELGAGGGTAATNGQINIKTLDVYVNTNVVMKNRNNASGCLEGHTYEQPQKLKRK